MVRSVGAVGTFVLGLHKKREKVHHPGLQHVCSRLPVLPCSAPCTPLGGMEVGVTEVFFLFLQPGGKSFTAWAER